MEYGRDPDGNRWQVNDDHTMARQAPEDGAFGEWFALSTVRQHFGPLTVESHDG